MAAVESGADAVYLAGKQFGARAYAANFDSGELKAAIEFAHKRDVLVDVAVNTAVDNDEFAELAEYLKFLYEIGADAIIVQDMGTARLAKEIVPDLPLHASTQMTVHNIEGVKLLQEMGFARVVLSRELSMEEIRYIAENVDIEIETFIHGALCICYSGQCLMSGMIGGRSGNRGRCAQPCRLPYTLTDENGSDVLKDSDAGSYLLSPKDMNTLEMIGEFVAAGVASLKIEGRMKRAEYVAVAVDTYRRAIDRYTETGRAAIAETDKKNLAQVFNRDFTTAYLKGRPGRLMMSDRRPNNRGILLGRVVKFDANKKMATLKLSEDLNAGDIVEFWVKVGGRVSATLCEMFIDKKAVKAAKAGDTVSFAIDGRVHAGDRVFKVFDAVLMERARSFFNTGAPVRRIAIDASVSASVGEPLKITVSDDMGNTGTGITEFIGQAALKRPLDAPAVHKQLARLGTTVYSLRNLSCNIEGAVMVPVSEINEARRKAIEELDQKRMAKFARKPLPIDEKNWLKALRVSKKRGKASSKLSVAADTVEKVRAAIENGADIIYFGGENFNHLNITADDYKDAYNLAIASGKKIYFALPRIIRKAHSGAICDLLASFAAYENLAGIAVSNIGAAQFVKKMLGSPLHADLYLNLYNNLAIAAWKKLGAASFTLSPELNFGQVEKIAASLDEDLECAVHGNLTLMVSEYCALGSFLGTLHTGACSAPCRKARYYLTDRKGERFPIATDQFCHMHVLNGKELCMYPHVQRLKEAGINRLRIEGRFMDALTLGKTVRLYKEFIQFGNEHPLLQNGQLDAVEGKNITRGHYFRGVL